MALVVSYGPGGPRIVRLGPWAVGRDGLAPPDAKERARKCRFCPRFYPPRSFVSDPDGSRGSRGGMRTRGFLCGRCALLLHHRSSSIRSAPHGCDHPKRPNWPNLALPPFGDRISNCDHRLPALALTPETPWGIGQGGMISARFYVDVRSTGRLKLGRFWLFLPAEPSACICALPWPPSFLTRLVQHAQVAQLCRGRVDKGIWAIPMPTAQLHKSRKSSYEAITSFIDRRPPKSPPNAPNRRMARGRRGASGGRGSARIALERVRLRSPTPRATSATAAATSRARRPCQQAGGDIGAGRDAARCRGEMVERERARRDSRPRRSIRSARVTSVHRLSGP